MPEIARSVNYTRPKDIAFNIPENDIGKVIGKGGTRIRELQQLSGARIIIRGAVVTLQGDAHQCSEAQRLIRRIVGGDGIRFIRDLDDQSFSLLADSSMGDFIASLCDEYDGDLEITSRNEVIIEAFDQSERTAEKMENALRAKLATSLRTVETRVAIEDPSYLQQIFEDQYLLVLKDQRGLHIRLDKDDTGSGVNLSGPAAVVAEAQGVIKDLLCSGRSTTLLPLTPNLLADLDSRARADFLRDINHHIEKKYGVRVSFDWCDNRIQISGELSIRALRVAAELVIYYKPSEAGIFFVRPPQAADHVCGRDEMHLTRLQSRDCTVVWNAHSCSVWICGRENSVRIAMDRLTNLLNEWLETHKVVEVQDTRRLGRVIGPGGQNLRNIQEKTCTVITTSEDGYIIIKGDTQQALASAEVLIHDALNAPAFSPRQDNWRSGGPRRGRGRGYRY